jgi:hypothetical protein
MPAVAEPGPAADDTPADAGTPVADETIAGTSDVAGIADADAGAAPWGADAGQAAAADPSADLL